jgi:putative membrane protein
MINLKIAKQSQRATVLCAAVLAAGTLAYSQAGTGGGGGMQQPSMPSQQQPTANTAGTAGSPTADVQNPQALDDQAFFKKALQGGAAEVQLGQLAQQKSQSDDVKQFGERMAKDHTDMGDKLLKPVAQSLGVKDPKGLAKKDSKLIATLNGLSGPQFDQEYIKAMIKDHKDDLKDYKSEGQLTQNPNIKQVTEQAQAVISKHLEMIEQIAQAHNVTADAK